MLSTVFIALAVLAPTGAQAATSSLKVTSSNSNVTSSCEFTVTRLNPPDSNGTTTVTARLTIKGAEIKPSFLSPRRVSTLNVACLVQGLDDPGQQVTLEKTNNRPTVYKSTYIRIPLNAGYRACVSATYLLRDGTLGTTGGACNPSV
jgi:hypothetical protein